MDSKIISVLLAIAVVATTGCIGMQNQEPQPPLGNVEGFSGALLAGDEETPLLNFNKEDYDKALASDKVVFLYFYANWCPICRAEVPKMYDAFDQLETDQVIGFRVNYNDNETDEDEIELARQFGVAYQHTKVILKDGEVFFKSPETWNEQRYLDEINRAVA